MPDDFDRLTLVDVGGAGGLKGEWQAVADRIRPIVFEPNPASAAKLRSSIEDQFGGSLLVTGLSDSKEERQLYLTASPGCVSTLEPNHEFLAPFSVNIAFEVRGNDVASCERYDELYRRGEVPLPECIKIDVQGYEYQVLKGFGSTLQSCLGIELESHFYPIYKQQHLFHDIVSYLQSFGLILRRTRPVNHFDGYEVEIDAWFTVSPERINQLSNDELAKLAFIEKIWNLPVRSRPFIPEWFP